MPVVAIVTGATSGIGEAFAGLLQEDNRFDAIWLVGRNLQKLSGMSKTSPKMIPVEADLTASGVNVIEEKIIAEKASIGLLINSAGIGYRAPFEEQTSDEINDTIQTNIAALTKLCRVCLPFMEDGRSGIINIASTAGFLPQPGFSVYAASKSYVISFSRALAEELKPRRISVTTVCTGPVATDFQRRATGGRDTEFKGFRAKIVKTPGEVAAKALKANAKNRKMLVVGASQKLFHFASKIIPHSWILKAIKW